LFFYAWEVVLSNVRVAVDVVTPRHRMKPGVVGIPLGDYTDTQVIVLANLLTMTPGTISLDISRDRKTLFVHAMYIDELEKFRRGIERDFVKRVREVVPS
jgi:multicomponent Na+:H+ antiporter subunit E